VRRTAHRGSVRLRRLRRRARLRRLAPASVLGLALAGGLAVWLLLGLGTQRSPALAARAGAHARHRASAGVPRAPARALLAPAPLAPAPPSPALARLARALRAQLQHIGGASGAVVADLSRGQLLFDVRGQLARPPASVEKLYTSVAVLRLLGPAARLATTVLGTGHLGADGVWDGSLYLRGGGDPTFGDGTFNRLYEGGYGPTAAQLARQLLAHGIRRVTGKLYGDESLLSSERGGMLTDLRPDIPDFGGELSALTYDHGQTGSCTSPAAFAARELAATLRAMGVRVRAARWARRTPTGAVPLAVVHSPPIEVLLRLMNVPSDDLFAELLDEQLGLRFGEGGTIAAGARVVARVISSAYGLRPTILDGSGLDRSDRSSPLEVVQFLRELWGTQTGRLLYATLPVVGREGTVQAIAAATAAAGRCAAKTGTLAGVSNLAGYCAARGGDELAFAIFIDGPPNWVALRAIGRMVAAIARY
jgi:D-alanyl-D-alanine carboxypeptidase/D-alanyl-D-alanine-endopeptidase (penicillin-binding protein 4)